MLQPEERAEIEAVGRAAADVREAARLTQEGLAHKLGVSDKTVSHIEKGTLRRINYLRMREWARVCHGEGTILEDVEHVLDYIFLSKDSITTVIRRRELPDGDGGERSTGSSDQMSYSGSVAHLRAVRAELPVAA